MTQASPFFGCTHPSAAHTGAAMRAMLVHGLALSAGIGNREFMTMPDHQRQVPPPEPALPGREPFFNLPGILVVLIGVLVAVHLARLALAFETDLRVMAELAVVPARFALDLGWMDQTQILQDTVAGVTQGQAAERMAVARFFLDDGGARWWSLLSYGLLHSGTAHIAMNCLWLAVFGSPLARRIGNVSFLLLLAAGTIAGAMLHIVMHPSDVAPMVGASAGVSAATGAAARFVFSQGLRMDMMGDDARVRALPALSLAGMVQNRQAMTFVILWFVTNWLFGAAVVPFADDDSSVAWEAHIGGFIAGLVLFPLLDSKTAKA